MKKGIGFYVTLIVLMSLLLGCVYWLGKEFGLVGILPYLEKGEEKSEKLDSSPFVESMNVDLGEVYLLGVLKEKQDSYWVISNDSGELTIQLTPETKFSSLVRLGNYAGADSYKWVPGRALDEFTFGDELRVRVIERQGETVALEIAE